MSILSDDDKKSKKLTEVQKYFINYRSWRSRFYRDPHSSDMNMYLPHYVKGDWKYFLFYFAITLLLALLFFLGVVYFILNVI